VYLWLVKHPVLGIHGMYDWIYRTPPPPLPQMQQSILARGIQELFAHPAQQNISNTKQWCDWLKIQINYNTTRDIGSLAEVRLTLLTKHINHTSLSKTQPIAPLCTTIGRILPYIIFRSYVRYTFQVDYGPLSFDVQRDLPFFAVEIYVIQKQNQA
jgi:hypothetical protein